MNIADEQPETSDRTKLLLLVGVVWVYAILVGSFWWVMVAIHDNHLGDRAVMAASIVYVVLVLSAAAGFNRLWRGMVACNWTPALMRLNRRTMLAAAIYAFVLLFVVWLKATHPAQGALAYGLALLPAVPVVGMVVAMGLYFREETDEFERAVRTENALWATGATLAIATVWGFAEMLANAPHASGWIWFPVWTVFGQAADFFIRRRYR